MRHGLTRSWNDCDIARLVELADNGATLLRAAAALNRRTTVVQKKARELGKSFPGVRKVRARLRELEVLT